MSATDIREKGIFFDQPGKGEEACLLTCRPKDVDLTSSELRLLGGAMVRAADSIDSVSSDSVSKPELAKAIEHLAHDVLEDSMDAGHNIALACLARNFGIMGDHQWPEFADGGTKDRIAALEAELDTAQKSASYWEDEHRTLLGVAVLKHGVPS